MPIDGRGLERDETVEWNDQSDDKQDDCHDLEDTGIEMESDESNLPMERVEESGEERTGVGSVPNPGSAAGGDPLAKWKSLITDRKKAGKELSFEKLSSAFGQAMQQLVKETEMEVLRKLAGETATEAQTDSDEMYAPSWKQRHCAVVKAGDRSPCERGWIKPVGTPSLQWTAALSTEQVGPQAGTSEPACPAQSLRADSSCCADLTI